MNNYKRRLKKRFEHRTQNVFHYLLLGLDGTPLPAQLRIAEILIDSWSSKKRPPKLEVRRLLEIFEEFLERTGKGNFHSEQGNPNI